MTTAHFRPPLVTTGHFRSPQLTKPHHSSTAATNTHHRSPHHSSQQLTTHVSTLLEVKDLLTLAHSSLPHTTPLLEPKGLDRELILVPLLQTDEQSVNHAILLPSNLIKFTKQILAKDVNSIIIIKSTTINFQT